MKRTTSGTYTATGIDWGEPTPHEREFVERVTGKPYDFGAYGEMRARLAKVTDADEVVEFETHPVTPEILAAMGLPVEWAR